MTLLDRIKYLRKNHLHLSQEEFGNQLGMSKSNISNIEIGRVGITDRNIIAICKAFDVNEEWLRTGKGEMFEAKTRDDIISDFMVDLIKEEDDSFQKRLIEALACLNEEEWKVLAGIAEKLAKKKD